EKEHITILLLDEMRQICQQNGADLIVLGFDLKNRLLDLINKENHLLINCRWDQQDTTMTVAGEGHPSGKANSIWAQKVVQYLKNHN
ncbi:MAG: hypothetical protein AAFO69_18820, partial [Bacteroidota bacterium]